MRTYRLLLAALTTLCLACLYLLLNVTAAQAQFQISDVEIGAHFGFNFSEGAIEDQRVGLQAIVPVLGSIELAPVFSSIYDFIDDPTGQITGSAWEGYFTARVRPFGRGSFWALGFGFTVWHASATDQVSGETASGTEFTDAFVLALELPIWSIRPMGELYVINALERDGQIGAHALFGVNIVLP